jgi:heme-degrading monooxygenase HmoA
MTYHLVWQFETDAARQADFEAAYGAEGEWARLFRQSDGYLGTELYRTMGEVPRYVTVDRWISRGAFDAFRLRYGAEYAALDERCGLLTAREAFLGDGEGGS